MPGSAAAAFGQAVVIGVSIAAPVGPIGLLTIQRTVQSGRAAGLATGLGAATADALYGAVGALGVTALISVLTAARVPLVLGGGLFLLWLAWKIARAPVTETPATPAGGADLLRCWAGTFVLTLSNPATVLAFLAIFGALADELAATSPVLMIGGVALGSALWWLLLSTVVGLLREHFDRRWRRGVNLLSAVALALFAGWQFSGLLG